MPKVTWPGATLLAPVPPALISCGTSEKANIFTAAWTGIICSKPPRTYVSIRPERYSHDIIEENGEFVINLPTEAIARQTDLCGVKSGRDADKFQLCNFTAEEGDKVKAPSIAQCPISLECKVFEIKRLGSHDMYLADILSVRVDPKYLDKDGRLMIEKCKFLSYAHGSYFAPGEVLGTFGFSVKKKPAKKRTQKSKK